MDLNKLKTNDYVLFLDGTVARVMKISRERLYPHLYFDREIKGEESVSAHWFYKENGVWGYRPGVGNDIIKILEDNNESN